MTTRKESEGSARFVLNHSQFAGLISHLVLHPTKSRSPMTGNVRHGPMQHLSSISLLNLSTQRYIHSTTRMPHYFVVDARFSLSTEPTYPPGSRHVHLCDLPEPFTKSRRGKMSRARSGSISIASLSNFPPSPVNRLAQSVGPEHLQSTREKVWSRHTTPAMSTRRENFFFTDSPDLYAAKSNRRSVWRRFTENVDKCVFRVVSKFYR